MTKAQLAQDMMRSRPPQLSESMNVIEAIRYLLKNGRTGAPVIDSNEKYLGVFSEKCSLLALQKLRETYKQSTNGTVPTIHAEDMMMRKLITLTPQEDVFKSINHLLKHKISGAPIIDSTRRFLGIFSEKSSMRVLVDALMESLPTTTVRSFMDQDQGRVVRKETSIDEIIQRFLDTPYRRLPVVSNNQLVGQISRRDVLAADPVLASLFKPVRSSKSSFASKLQSAQDSVESYMDTNARTIGEQTDVLRIAQIFMNSPYRRLPVLKSGNVVGLVDRRDLLKATQSLMHAVRDMYENPQDSSVLYISSVSSKQDSTII